MAGACPSRRSGLRLLGLGVSAAFGALVLVVVVVGLLVMRACEAGGDWRFSARVNKVQAGAVCLSLIGDGPGYVENGCVERKDIVGLPEDIRVDECLRLNQQLHSELVYEQRERC